MSYDKTNLSYKSIIKIAILIQIRLIVASNKYKCTWFVIKLISFGCTALYKKILKFGSKSKAIVNKMICFWNTIKYSFSSNLKWWISPQLKFLNQIYSRNVVIRNILFSGRNRNVFQNALCISRNWRHSLSIFMS